MSWNWWGPQASTWRTCVTDIMWRSSAGCEPGQHQPAFLTAPPVAVPWTALWERKSSQTVHFQMRWHHQGRLNWVYRRQGISKRPGLKIQSGEHLADEPQGYKYGCVLTAITFHGSICLQVLKKYHTRAVGGFSRRNLSVFPSEFFHSSFLSLIPFVF